MRFDLVKGFPLLATKKIYLKAIIHELLGFISGDTNIKYLVDHDIKIRNERAYSIYLRQIGQESKYPRYSSECVAKLELFVDQIKQDRIFAQKWGISEQYMVNNGDHGQELMILYEIRLVM